MQKILSKTFLSTVILCSVLGSSACAARTENTAAVNNNAANAAAANSNAENLSNETPAESASGQTASAPDAVIKDLYKTHDRDNGAILDSKNRKLIDKYFDKTLADLIWKDLTANRDEVGVLDFDPFYNAQDTQIKNFAVAPPKIEGERASVTVTFQNFDRKDTLSYQLARRNSVWKIADIKYTDGTTLLGYFKEDAKNNAKADDGGSTDNFFEGTYRVGDTTCTVKAVKMAFEVKWAKGSGTMIFVFDGDATAGKYTYSSEDGGKGKDTFIFDDDTFTTGKFIRADGKQFPVSKVK